MEVLGDVVVNGYVVIRAGASAIGQISKVREARSLGRRGIVALNLKYVESVTGEHILVSGTAGRRQKEKQAKRPPKSSQPPQYLVHIHATVLRLPAIDRVLRYTYFPSHILHCSAPIPPASTAIICASVCLLRDIPVPLFVRTSHTQLCADVRRGRSKQQGARLKRQFPGAYKKRAFGNCVNVNRLPYIRHGVLAIAVSYLHSLHRCD
jgi:hypothetical protein